MSNIVFKDKDDSLEFDVYNNFICIDCEKRKQWIGGYIVYRNIINNTIVRGKDGVYKPFNYRFRIYKPFSYLFRITWLFNQFLDRHSKYKYTEQFIPKSIK